jgi:hypothetical protein
MITPYGVECPFYYEDFARGADRQECRIPKNLKNPRYAAWIPGDCIGCEVPQVLAANGSPHLELRMTVRVGAFGMGRRIEVEASCALHGPITVDPRLGCPACNEEADAILREALG